MSGNSTVPFKVAVGSHYVYALVNLPTSITLTNGQNIQRVIEVATATQATGGYSDGSNSTTPSFFMVNAKHDAATNAGVSTTITSANTVTTPATATINVDRVAVKIVPKASTPTVTITTDPANFITGVTIQGYLLLNANKKFNLVQDWGTGNTNGTTLSSEALQTPLYPGGTNLVKNQYFHNISEYTTITKSSGTITGIEDITLAPGYTGLKTIGNAIYATENRPTLLTYSSPAKPTAGQGETTGIIYKVNSGKGTFYEYKGKIYTDLTGLQTAYGATTLPTNISEIRAKGIRVYDGGIMYYTYFIKGTNSNTNHKWGTPAENYYGVFRNSVYNLTVDSITKLGDDVPGGGRVDPEEPGEPGNPPINSDAAYLKVTVTVNQWVLNAINIDF